MSALLLVAVFSACFLITLAVAGAGPLLVRRTRPRRERAARVGAQAGAVQPPDAMHLEPAPDDAARADVGAQRLTLALEREGFLPAGTFTVAEIPDLVVQLLVQEQEGLWGAVYQHPDAGAWLDVVRRRLGGGRSTTWTTGPLPEGAPRPNHPIVHLPRASVDDLMRRVRAEAQLRAAAPARRDQARAAFEQVWAESAAWVWRRLRAPEGIGPMRAAAA